MKKLFTKALVLLLLVISAFFGLEKNISIEDYQEQAYQGEGIITFSTEKIEYSRKTESTSSIYFDFPMYECLTLPNNCAPVGGSIALGYYDEYYPNLIPNYEAVYYYKGEKYYKIISPEVDTLIAELYERMGTNQGVSGTTYEGFKTGLQSYINTQGYTVSYSSLMSSGKLNLNNVYSSLNAGKPEVLFMTSIRYVYRLHFYEYSGYDYIGVQTANAGHVSVAYGKREIKYYRNETKKVWSPIWYNPFRFINVTEEVNFRTNRYLMVSFGNSTLGYMDITDTGGVQQAINLNIF